MLHFKFESPYSLIMAPSHHHLSIFLLSLIFSSSCSCTSVKNPTRWALFDSFHIKATRHDLMNPPVAYPAGPVTNPVTTPSLVPPVVTVPATNPVGLTPIPAVNPMPLPVPAANPVTPAAPVINPVAPPAVPVTNPVTPAVPVTNPVTGPGTGMVPVVAPPVTIPTPTPGTAVPGTAAPAVSGQSWCVAKTGTQDTSLQSAIDYACGIGGADCSSIQQGAACYNPNTVQNHASVAFNSYYQKNPSPTSCDFGGVAMLTSANPSSGSCVYPTSASSSSSMTPGTGMPTPATPSSSGAGIGAAPISFGTPPNVLNSSNPGAAGANAGLGNAPLGATDSLSGSNHFQPTAVSCIILIITWIMAH